MTGVAIVGGGISGLALGAALQARGIPFHLFEAATLPGGVIRSVRLGDRTLELGPQRVRRTPEVERLLVGTPRSTTHERVWIGRNGRLHPLPGSLREGARSSLLSLRGRLRLALEPFIPGDGADPEISSARWLEGRVGREAYQAILGPLFGGLYGSDPQEMDARRALLPALREMGADRSLLAGLLRRRMSARGSLLSHPPILPEGGMAALPWALARVLGDHLSLATPVEALVRHPRGGWVLGTPDGSRHAETVVLTLPPDRASRLLTPWASGAAQALRQLRMNPVALVHLDMERLPPGLGFQVAFGEEGRMRGMTFSGHLDGTGRTAVAFLGGMRDPAAVALPDGELEALAASEAERWTGVRGTPLHLWRTRMPAWDRSFRALDGLRLPGGVHLLANYTGRPGIIGRLREAEALAERLARQRAGSQAQAGSAASGSPFMA